MLLVIPLSGCGHHTTQRERVARYVKQVNQLEAALAKPLASVTQAGQQFARQRRLGVSPISALVFSPAPELIRAVARIRELRGRAVALRPPPPARHLHSLVLALIDGQEVLAREVASLSTFLPRFELVLHPLDPAMRRLTAALSRHTAAGTAAVAAVYAAKASALRQFKAVLEQIAAQLRTLRPPAVSRPVWTSELTALTGMSASAGRLAGALASGPGPAVSRDLLAFNHAAASNHTVAAQKAQIASVQAYNRSIRRLFDLAREIERERLRLAESLK